MARTITDIQQEILIEKDNYEELKGLTDSATSTSKTAIWKLWVYIVSAAIWMHEKIVDRNALLSRPHTLSWYREQAFNYLQGIPLVWKDGYFQFDIENRPLAELETAKKIKYCSISERLYSEIENKINPANGLPYGDSQDVADLIKQYYYNQVGIVTMKVAKEEGGKPSALSTSERTIFQAYMNQIKDAGTQIRVVSTTGDQIQIVIDVYVDPLIIYTNEENGGKFVKDLSQEPVKETVLDYLQNLEFNGAFVPTFFIDKIQQIAGVRLPIIRSIKIGSYDKDLDTDGTFVYNDSDATAENAFFVPTSGYFNTNFGEKLSDDPDNPLVNKGSITINYFPYNLQTDPNFSL